MGGEVLLRTVTEGVGENGGMGSVMVCSLRGYFLTPADGGEAGASSGVRMLSDDDVCAEVPFERLEGCRIQVGEGDCIPAIELALSHSKKGQALRVRCTSKYAYHEEGRPERPSSSDISATVAIPEFANLEYEIFVTDVQELSLLGLETEEEEIRHDARLLEKNQVYQSMLLRKECGNRWYHYNSLLKASRAYSKGAKAGDDHFTSWQEGDTSSMSSMSDARIAKTKQLTAKTIEVYISCLNNLSACYISSGEFFKAREICTKILELDNTNIKALLRAARASLALLSFEECAACIAKVLELEPENALALNEQVKLKKAQKDSKIEDKKFARKMFGADLDKEKIKSNSSNSSNGKNTAKPEIERRRDEAEKMGVKNKVKADEDSGSTNVVLLLVIATIVLFISIFIAQYDPNQK